MGDYGTNQLRVSGVIALEYLNAHIDFGLEGTEVDFGTLFLPQPRGIGINDRDTGSLLDQSNGKLFDLDFRSYPRPDLALIKRRQYVLSRIRHWPKEKEVLLRYVCGAYDFFSLKSVIDRKDADCLVAQEMLG